MHVLRIFPADFHALYTILSSDHQYIEITIDSSVKNCTFTRYKTRHGNHNIFLKNLKHSVNSILGAFRNSQNEKDIYEATNFLQNSVIEACNKSYRSKNQNLSPTPIWYTQDLEVEKKPTEGAEKTCTSAISLILETRSEKCPIPVP
ncbi:hypothetical protein AVEN_66561-1 [Araneus ventricosus]|uniref:Endonuclease/exonuclease/phosphatase domain-containing protein n=1 Tax=Araneus ventricosus TaxID=182803 RepID=A0A4Y2EJJ0_ARAVE|nr:hypothetical protein AVEN_66561-1 [Araneus ventricosus]